MLLQIAILTDTATDTAKVLQMKLVAQNRVTVIYRQILEPIEVLVSDVIILLICGNVA